jgi:hypothetical protein
LLTMDILCLALNDDLTSAEHKPKTKSKQSVGDIGQKCIRMPFFLRHRDKDHQEERSITLDIHIILLSWPIQYNDIVVFVRCFLLLLGICWWKPVILFFASRPDNLQNLIRYSV